MDEAEVRIFVAMTRLRSVIGEFAIELQATKEELKTLTDITISDVYLKLGME